MAAGHDGPKAVRVVGDQAVDPAVDQRAHLHRVVYGPRNHGQALSVRLPDQSVGQDRRVERDHLGVQPVSDDPRQWTVERVGRDHEAAGPWRAGEDRRRIAQRDPAQVGLEAARDLQCAPVEGLQQAAAHGVVGADDVDHLRRECLRIDRVVRRCRVDLGLDVKLDVARAIALGELEDLVERRHTGAGHGLLRAHERVARRVVRVARPTVECFGLREREVLDELANEVV